MRDDRHSHQQLFSVLAAVLAAIVLFCASCSASDGDDSSADTPNTAETSTPTTVLPSTASTQPASSNPDTSAEPATTTSTSEPTSTSESSLPGEPFEGFVSEGDTLAVMGVEHDDVLNVRAAPGVDQPIVTTLRPTADDVVATGAVRRLERSIWYEVRASGVTGWASFAFLGFSGRVDDVTADYVARSSPTEADTLTRLGELVAESFATEAPRSRIVESVEAEIGDLGEVTFDVIGIGDDAVAGYRLHVFATPGDDRFVVRSIERTIFCTRGVDDGLCT